MAKRKIRSIDKRGQDRPKKVSSLKKGDTVMVIAGGNKQKRENKGKIGKIVAFVGEKKDRVVIEGLNFVTRHRKQMGPNQPAGKFPREASVHISNVMFYAEKLKKPVRLKHSFLKDGKKVRGFIDSKTKEFVQV